MRLLRRQGGLTLIEVTVAILIIAVAMTTVTTAVFQVVNSARTMRERMYSNWIAQNQLAELRLAAELPDVGESNGEVFYAGVDWTWEATIAETGVENLYRVDVAVSRPGADTSIWSVTGFVGEPSVPGQANRAWNAISDQRGDTE